MFRKSMLLVAAALMFAYSPLSGSDKVSVSYEDNGKALINPGMGFCEYAYAGRLWNYGCKTPAWDALDWFPGCSTVYLRLLWSDLEPKEGEYRWDILDRYSQAWAATGKKLALRVICCNQTKNACPDFVREAGAKGIWFKYEENGAENDYPERWEPEFDDPVFLEKFGNFLKVFADRYDGNPNVAFVDVGSFGLYGEGHSIYLTSIRRTDPERFNRMARIHLDMWRNAMPNTYLMVSDDIGGSVNKDPDHPNMAYARELGIGFRDDSIFCNLNNFWYHGGWAQRFALETPVMVETGHLPQLDYGGKLDEVFTEENVMKCVEEYRASYFSIHDYPAIHLKRFRSIIEKVNMRLGYRIVPEEISYPAVVTVDEPVVISSRWHNAGVAPCYGGGRIAWMLLDKKGNVCWNWVDESFDVKELAPTIGGAVKPSSIKSTVFFGHNDIVPDPDVCLTWSKGTPGRDPGACFRMLVPGTYTLCFAITDKIGVPTIAVPVKGDDSRRIYPVGKIKVVSE